jgi:hypothetical protein
MQKKRTVQSQNGFDSLKYDKNAPVPQLGDKDVLINVHRSITATS